MCERVRKAAREQSGGGPLNVRALFEVRHCAIAPARVCSHALAAPRQEFDRDLTGEVEADELDRGLQKLGLRLEDEELRALLDKFDSDGDGKISFKEFQSFLARTDDAGAAAGAAAGAGAPGSARRAEPTVRPPRGDSGAACSRNARRRCDVRRPCRMLRVRACCPTRMWARWRARCGARRRTRR